MESYFESYKEHAILHEKPDRRVAVATSLKPAPSADYPHYFVLKRIRSPEEPSEFVIHRAMSAVHPSFVRFYHSWAKHDSYFMAIEFCERGDLHTDLQRCHGSPYSWQIVLHKSYELAVSVYYLHSYQYAHRDIKPLNVFITNDWAFKLGDFGETKAVRAGEQYHTVRGTPYYMSPEMSQSREAQEKKDNEMHTTDPFRDDIWALGLTLTEIAMGRLCPTLCAPNSFGLHFNTRSRHSATHKYILKLSLKCSARTPAAT
jgi:serine/threonine protein kinase